MVTAVFKNNHTPLPNLHARGALSRNAADQREKGAGDAAMSHGHDIAVERHRPGGDAGGQIGVTLAARRRKTPFIGLARGGANGIARFDLGPCQALPLPEGQFDQRRVHRIGERIEPHGGARQFHRLAGAAERRGDESVTRQRTGAVPHQPFGEKPAGARGYAGVQAAAQSVPAAARGQRVYYEVDAAPHAAGRGTFIDELLTTLGLVNIIDASLGPYPKINPELVVRADPDLIMVSQQGAAQLARRPGWAQLRALRQGHVCAFDAEQRDILVRPGPRIPEAALLMADCAAHRMPAEK